MLLDTRFKASSATPGYAVTPDFLLEGFLLSRRSMGCTRATLLDYKRRLTQFFRFIDRELPGQEIRRFHIDSYLAWLADNGRSRATVRTNYRALHAFYNWQVEDELIERSPMAKMKLPRIEKRSKPFLAEGHFHQLLTLCSPPSFMRSRNAAVLWLFWSTGMRLGELAGLRVDDLNWDGSWILVFGKGNRERRVPFSKEAKRAVWRYLAFRKDNLPQLWLSEERTPMAPEGLRMAINRLYRRSGIQVKDVCHIFRRTWAMRQIKSGIPPKFVQLTGGWIDIKTLDGYIQAMTSEDALGAKWV